MWSVTPDDKKYMSKFEIIDAEFLESPRTSPLNQLVY